MQAIILNDLHFFKYMKKIITLQKFLYNFKPSDD